MKRTEIRGEGELLNSFNLSTEYLSANESFLVFPLKQSTYPAALYFSHNSFAIFLAEELPSVALTKNSNHANQANAKKQLDATREGFEGLIFLRMKVIHSPAEIIVRTSETDWMCGKHIEKKRLAEKAD